MMSSIDEDAVMGAAAAAEAAAPVFLAAGAVAAAPAGESSSDYGDDVQECPSCLLPRLMPLCVRYFSV